MTKENRYGKVKMFKDFEQKEGRSLYNYNKLSGRIIEVFGTRYKFAEAMGWSERTLSLKMNGNRDWKQLDISKAIKLLNLTAEDIPLYFFNRNVQWN